MYTHIEMLSLLKGFAYESMNPLYLDKSEILTLSVRIQARFCWYEIAEVTMTPNIIITKFNLKLL